MINVMNFFIFLVVILLLLDPFTVPKRVIYHSLLACTLIIVTVSRLCQMNRSNHLYGSIEDCSQGFAVVLSLQNILGHLGLRIPFPPRP